MKKIFIMILALGLASTGLAQFTYGPKLGINLAKFSGEKMMPGGQAGVFLNGELWDRIGIQTDFLWTLKGSRHTQTDTVYTVTTNTMTGTTTTNTSTATAERLSYYRFVDIPICVYFPISEHIRGFFGPQVSVFRAGHEKNSFNGKTSDRDITGVKGQISLCGGFDFKSNSPIIIGVRFVTNKFTGGEAIQPTTSTKAEVRSLNAVMINIAYRMTW